MKGLPSGDAIVHGRDLQGPFEETCDVVIAGSGAGGSVVATHLAEAGLRVIVLEEGPYYRPEQYQGFKPSEAFRKLYRESGMATAFGVGETPIIAVAMGRAVGGSSLLTGGGCFRVPSVVHHRWVHDLGLEELSERALEPAYEDVERRLHVREVPASMRSRSTEKFVEGATKLGIPMRPIRRNTGDSCEGNGRCNFTCPIGAKRSVDVSYLPSAVARGTRIISDALATRVLEENGRAAGLTGHLLDERGKRSHRFTIKAPVVIAACGTLHTPLLLEASGLGRHNDKLGQRITLHPGIRCIALFDDRLEGWDGALQSVYSDHFDHQGIKLVGIYSSVNVMASGMPGVGPKLRRMAREMPHLGAFGAMIHDEGGGRVRAGLSREPILTYEMAPLDLQRLRRSITILAEIALASGARAVFPSVVGADPIHTMDDALALERKPLDPRRIECMAFHPLGSARASNDRRRGLVDQNGETFELPGLFVADGSILPTSIGVNSQVAIMSMATRIGWRIAERFRHFALRASA